MLQLRGNCQVLVIYYFYAFTLDESRVHFAYAPDPGKVACTFQDQKSSRPKLAEDGRKYRPTPRIPPENQTSSSAATKKGISNHRSRQRYYGKGGLEAYLGDRFVGRQVAAFFYSHNRYCKLRPGDYIRRTKFSGISTYIEQARWSL